MCMASGESVMLLNESKPRARKQHRCGECSRTIEPGEVYETETFIWEGDLDTAKSCLQCRAAGVWLQKVCGGWNYYQIAEDLAEHLWEPEVRTSKMVRLVRYQRRKWRNRAGELVTPEQVREWVRQSIAATNPAMFESAR